MLELVSSIQIGLSLFTLTLLTLISLSHPFVIHVPSSLVKRIGDYQHTKTIYVGKEFNNCPNEEPFPCKTTDKCISLKHVCDNNYDCPDKWDENEAVCIAYQRVPAEDLVKFVRQQANWLVPSFFSSIVRNAEDLNKIASALSTSPNIDIFQTKLKLSREETKKFESALYAVRGNDVQALEEFGMKPDSWTEVKIVFKNLIDSGMIKKY